MFLVVTFSKVYLENHYVSKEYFDESITKITEERKEFAAENKEQFKSINGKLDLLLETNASSAEKFADEERRIGDLEKKWDWLSQKRP